MLPEADPGGWASRTPPESVISEGAAAAAPDPTIRAHDFISTAQRLMGSPPPRSITGTQAGCYVKKTTFLSCVLLINEVISHQRFTEPGALARCPR